MTLGRVSHTEAGRDSLPGPLQGGLKHMETDSRIVTCSGCRRQVGALAEIRGQDWLQVNGLIVRSLHGVCRDCGAEFHWSVSDRALAKIVQGASSDM